MSPYTQQQAPPQGGPPHLQANQPNSGGGQPQQAGGVHHPGVIPTGAAQAIPQQFAHPLQYPTAMYPPVQVMPGSIPGNVFVSNVTANVNVHGWHTPLTQFQVPTYVPAQEVPVAQSPGHDSQVII